MIAQLDSKYVSVVRLGLYVAAAIMALTLLWSLQGRPAARAQEPAGPSGAPAPTVAAPTTTSPVTPKDKSINLIALFIAGGIFMIPITGMSILAVTMAIERSLALRDQRVLP